MIQIVILVDFDEANRGRSEVPLAAQAPPGYIVSELRCVRWSLNKAGAVELDLRFVIAGPVLVKK